ncbi:transcription elongation factor SPT5 [Lates japonicus]|uniref:Transcription elongation factor SPT5 n=1 Tax=Lates japonicus TaxID=270547 RepID=A0AAD3NIM2_LATJO|nr:transcription elongation factor SPT5 [Lates japonicus]
MTLKVLPRDLQLCSETASGVDAGGQHEWGELVQLDPQTVGVIVRLERETFQVLNMHGKVLTVRHQAVNRRKDNRFAVALDSEQNNIHVKDIVKVIDGPHSGREGEIRHLFRGFAFLHCKKLVENGGMFVCKTRHLVLAGGSKPRDVTNFTVGGFAPMSPRISSPMHHGGGGGCQKQEPVWPCCSVGKLCPNFMANRDSAIKEVQKKIIVLEFGCFSGSRYDGKEHELNLHPHTRLLLPLGS